MSDLKDPRVLFAAERTLLAWQRTALALMGFGFVVERFGLLIVRLGVARPDSIHRTFSLWLGMLLVIFACVVAVLSAQQFRQVVRGLGVDEIPPGYRTQLGVWVNLLLALVGVAFVVYFAATA